MPIDVKPAPGVRSVARSLALFLVCLLATLCVLFHRSFQADQVLFSNDGPLGANRSQAEYALSNFRGYWQNLNWLGMEYPGFFLDPSGFLLASCCKFSPEFGPVLFAKIYAPFGVFLLGLCAWFLFTQLRFRPWVCVLGGLAAALNTAAFSPACWGLATWPLAWAMNFLALAVLAAPSISHWGLKAAMAGFAVGLGVMEGFDVGAVFSLFTAALAFLSAMTTRGTLGKRITRGAATVAIMAICAGLIAAQAVSSLISTQLKDVVGMAQDEATKQKRWDEATQWSLPKAETLRVIIPGLFGYRMPELYGDPVASTGGSNYWGATGQTPGIIQSRHSGMGFYAGITVAIMAAFGVAQSLRSKGNVFAPEEKKQIWCLLAVATVSMLLAWGRHAPFYRLIYALPYASTVRNPFKFMFPFSLCLLALSGYGLEALDRLYLNKPALKPQPGQGRLKAWWKTAPSFDRKWTRGCLIAVGASLVGWLIYAASKNELIHYLQQAGFPDHVYPQLAASIAQFSISEVGRFILFLVLSVALLILIMSGMFSGRQARVGLFLLSALLVIDLSRADAPWIVYWNYKQKYASNPIVDLLRQKPYERRVTAELVPTLHFYLISGQTGQQFAQLYGYEWLQHLFLYYRIHSFDIIQMPRIPEMDSAYMAAFRPLIKTDNGIQLDESRLHLCARLWRLTNTRYMLGSTDFVDVLNDKLDPAQRRFQIRARFEVVPKPGIVEPTRPEHFTAALSTNGPLALFEFTGALPRVKLFSQWQVNTNDQETLQRLTSADFDPEQTVIVGSEFPRATAGTGTNQLAGTVEIVHYEPQVIRLTAEAAVPSVLLLNDRHNPNWNVFVDGTREPLLRCNYIMRGVYLAPGKHVVEFRFQPLLTAFYISLTALAAGVMLCGYLVVTKNSARPSEAPSRSDSLPSNIADRKSR